MPTAIIRRTADDASLLNDAALHPILARVYSQRGITSMQQLERGLAHLLPWDQLKGIASAVALLSEAIAQQQRILIIGDFDCDGATSSALAVRGLRMLGAKQVDYLVPNRFEYGYGLTPEIVAVAAARSPDVIVTVDNGISSIEGVAAANARGIRVLVTDHHLPGSQLPSAAAMVNPNQPGDDFPSKNLAGVGVIFYVLLGLRARLREQAAFAGGVEPNLAELLDLVALGTVADVVPLDHNNRILVGQGLARIRAGQCSAGIAALINVAKRNPANLAAADLGFALGPRLNAAGRLDDMSLGIELLLTDDPARAQALAQRLDDLNHQRRAIEGEMQAEAMAILDEMALALEEGTALPTGLCLYEPHWHQGVIGILASRIKDRLHRPVIVFAQADDGSLKGSARSVPGLHIRDAFDAVAAANPGLLSKFGGHAMAAGLSLAAEDFGRFQAAFDAEVRRHLSAEDLRREILSDGELPADGLSLELAEALRAGGPWGQGFPEPLFDGVFELVSRRIVGEKHLKLVLRAPGSEQPVDAIAFNTVDDDWPGEVQRVALAYRLDVNEFNGRRSAQLLVEYIEPQ